MIYDVDAWTDPQWWDLYLASTVVTGNRPAFAFLHNPRTGGQSIQRVLEKHFEVTTGLPHPLSDYGDRFRFGFVRNPWDRLVSAYENNKAHIRANTFEAFVKTEMALIQNQHWVPQLLFVEHLDFVGRYENIQLDWKRIATTLGIPDAVLPHTHRKPHPHYSRYFTSETRELVRRFYNNDVEHFHYSFEEETPEQARAWEVEKKQRHVVKGVPHAKDTGNRGGRVHWLASNRGAR